MNGNRGYLRQLFDVLLLLGTSVVTVISLMHRSSLTDAILIFVSAGLIIGGLIGDSWLAIIAGVLFGAYVIYFGA